MKKTITLDEKIKKYGAFALSVAGASTISAQVVYTDINPDQVLTTTTNPYILDFNNDAVPDIGFGMFEGVINTTYGGLPVTVDYIGGGAFFGTFANSSNGWMGVYGSNGMAPIGLNNGSSIGSQGMFSNDDSSGILGGKADVALGGFPYGTFQSGDFIGQEKFLGVRFDVAGAIHYGWVRVEIASNFSSMTIKDYAYEATAGVAINAGDVGGGNSVGIDNLSNDIIIRNLYNKLNIELVNADNASISLVNLAGQIVINDQMNSNVKEINMNDLTTGVYMVNVTTDKGSITKKIYVK
jgi:hypothetical protein